MVRNFKVIVWPCSCFFLETQKVRKHFSGESPEFPGLGWHEVKATDNTCSTCSAACSTVNAGKIAPEHTHTHTHTHSTEYCIPTITNAGCGKKQVRYTLLSFTLRWRGHVYLSLRLAFSHAHTLSHMHTHTHTDTHLRPKTELEESRETRQCQVSLLRRWKREDQTNSGTWYRKCHPSPDTHTHKHTHTHILREWGWNMCGSTWEQMCICACMFVWACVIYTVFCQPCCLCGN